jgi:hypothetical protein
MMMNVEQSVEWELAGETEEVRENLPHRHLSIKNPTWSDLGSKQGRRSVKPATNSLSYGTASIYKVTSYIQSICSSGQTEIFMLLSILEISSSSESMCE